MARLDFLRFHRNRCVSNGSDGLHRTTFQPSSKYCLHFRFHLMTKLPVTQVDSTVLPVSFLDSVGLQDLSTGIWSRVLDMCAKSLSYLNSATVIIYQAACKYTLVKIYLQYEQINFYKGRVILWEVNRVTNIILFILTGLQCSESI